MIQKPPFCRARRVAGGSRDGRAGPRVGRGAMATNSNNNGNDIRTLGPQKPTAGALMDRVRPFGPLALICEAWGHGQDVTRMLYA
eukprot:171846-Pyramimonas_sp.AAC.1